MAQASPFRRICNSPAGNNWICNPKQMYCRFFLLQMLIFDASELQIRQNGGKKFKSWEIGKRLRAGGAGRYLRLHHAQPGEDVNFFQDAHG